MTTEQSPDKFTALYYARREVEGFVARLKSLEPAFAAAEGLRTALDGIPISTINHAGDYRAVLIHLCDPDREHLVEIAKYLTRSGYHLAGINEEPDLKLRIYRYGDIEVFVRFEKEGAACGFVQVGTETKPVYKFQCQEAV